MYIFLNKHLRAYQAKVRRTFFPVVFYGQSAFCALGTSCVTFSERLELKKCPTSSAVLFRWTEAHSSSQGDNKAFLEQNLVFVDTWSSKTSRAIITTIRTRNSRPGVTSDFTSAPEKKKAALAAPHVWHHRPFKLLDKVTVTNQVLERLNLLQHGFHTALSSILSAVIGRCKTSVYSEIIDFTNQAVVLCLRLFILIEIPSGQLLDRSHGFTIVTINNSQLFSIKQKQIWYESEEWEAHLFPSEMHQK